MRLTRPRPGTCANPLLILLCATALPCAAADHPDAPSAAHAPVEASAVEPAHDSPAALATVPREAEEMRVEARRDPGALGPLSIGTPDAGLLLNPLPFPEGSFWTVRDPRESWGTDETIAYLIAAIESVEARYPGSPRLVIGDLSNPVGGRLNRHRSHQAGRDADVGFYYARGAVDAFLTETDVDRIFVDRSIMALLYREAVEEGEERAWLDDVFGRADDKGVIQHVARHKDHFHVRFYNPRAQERGRIAYQVLVETGAAPPPTVKHRVRPGETLGSLARRYGASAPAIRAANGLRGSRLRVGRSYTIPIRRVPPDEGPVVVPPRRVPPPPEATASATALIAAVAAAEGGGAASAQR
jgi:murein endopeptidase